MMKRMMTMMITATAVMMMTQGNMVRREKEEQGHSASQATWDFWIVLDVLRFVLS